MGWQDTEQVIGAIKELLSDEAAAKLEPADKIVQSCSNCDGALMDRGSVNGMGVLECLKCRLPYLRGSNVRIAVPKQHRGKSRRKK